MTTWKSAPEGKIQKFDVSIAKNYLTEKEIYFLNRLVSMYLDYAEIQADNSIPMTMEDWANRLDNFIEFNGRDLLIDVGKYQQNRQNYMQKHNLFNSDFDLFSESQDE